MKISLDWLRDFVACDDGPERLAEQLTMLGLNVEDLERYALEFPGVVVGKVLETAPHPNADRLTLCRVHDGRETLDVVCGAPNVAAGQHVLLATPGAVLPGGIRIKKSRIRGQDSCGMICSARELELGDDAGGIMVLPDEPAPGTTADALLGFEDWVFDIEITPNRPDWLSHLGVAREIAALKGAKVALPQVWSGQQGRGSALDCTVDIEDFADCPRYTAHGAQGVSIGPSPDFMQNRLRAVGSRPISNVVDITNYVMYELGQPLHAFDRGRLEGDRIFVRRAAAGERIRTLDGQDRKLTPGHLVIADGAGAVAVAGVMGGERSEVTDATTDLILESAFFAPRLVRQGSRSLGLVTDSSYRFEREADWDMVLFAARRALHLLEQHAEAHIISDWQDRQDPDHQQPPKITLRVNQVNRVLGTEMQADTAAGLLQQLNLKVTPLGRASERGREGARLVVEAPSFRRDLRLEVDLIEEIARLHGYDRIETDTSRRIGGMASRGTDESRRRRLRNYLAAAGFAEIVTSTFFDDDDLDRLGLAEDDVRRRCLRILNPRHGGGVHLRTSLMPALLRVCARNINADNKLPLRLFQVGRIFQPGAGRPVDARHEDEGLLPAEPAILQIAVAGSSGEDGLGLPSDLSELKGIVANLAALLRLDLGTEPAAIEPYLEDGRQFVVRDDSGNTCGAGGSVKSAVLAAFDIETPVAVAELLLDSLPKEPRPVAFRAFSRFPAVKRDLSLLAPEEISYRTVEDVVRREGGPLLESVELFDIYHGKGLPEGRRAMGIRLKFRSDKGNLKGKTVDQAIAKIGEALAAGHDVTIRS